MDRGRPTASDRLGAGAGPATRYRSTARRHPRARRGREAHSSRVPFVPPRPDQEHAARPRALRERLPGRTRRLDGGRRRRNASRLRGRARHAGRTEAASAAHAEPTPRGARDPGPGLHPSDLSRARDRVGRGRRRQHPRPPRHRDELALARLDLQDRDPDEGQRDRRPGGAAVLPRPALGARRRDHEPFEHRRVLKPRRSPAQYGRSTPSTATSSSTCSSGCGAWTCRTA